MSLLGLFFLPCYLLSLHKSPILFRVNVEYHPIYNNNLGKESECIASHIGRRIVQSANNSFKKSEIVVPWDDIRFCEFEENFANLSSAISWFVHETFVKKFQKLFFGGMIDNLGVRIPSFLS